MGPEHPAGSATSAISNGRAVVSDLAHEAGLRNVDKFARSWHILMKGSIISATEGDGDAAKRAKAMARSLIAAHRDSGHKDEDARYS